MAKIRRDEHGLYLATDGCKCRPVGDTQFKEGDNVPARHRPQTICAGVGKDKTCKRGQYLETWTTTGCLWNESPDDEADMIAWYKVQMFSRYGHVYNFKRPTKEEEKIAADWMKRKVRKLK